MPIGQSLGAMFNSPDFAPAISGTTAGLGAIGNLIAGIDQSKEQNFVTAQQNKIANLTPSQLTSMVTGAEAPINQSLIQNVDNSVQADVASRGLAQAPGIFASEESQALAPYEQQNYQTALQQVLSQLGLPLEYASAIQKFLPGQTNLTPALMLFLKSLQGRTATGGSGGASTNPAALLNLIQSGSDSGTIPDLGLDSSGATDA